MSEARDEILGRIRAALVDVPDQGGEAAAVEAAADEAAAAAGAGYRRHGERSAAERADLLAQRLADYGAQVRRTPAADVAAAVAAACGELGLSRVVVPPGLDSAWRPPDGVTVIEDDDLRAAELDALDGAVTGCAGAIAETGTIVLDGQGRSGRRVLTLVPDHHVCVVEPGQIVELVPEGIARLADAVRHHRAPVTFISGPSASSDIELSRVEGVHGPRHLLVIIVDPD